jgi:hypothetical protein
MLRNSPFAICDVIPLTKAADKLDRSPVPNVKSKRGVLDFSRLTLGSIVFILLSVSEPMKIKTDLIGNSS